MIGMKRGLLAMVAAVSAVPLGLAAPAPAEAQLTGPVMPFEYAVKFVCRRNLLNTNQAVAPGNYFTAINVHNPGGAVEFTYKSALAPIGTPGKYTKFKSPFQVLKYDEAIEFDCNIIFQQFIANGINPPPGFFTGFFVIQSPRELDVVAVYTATPISPPEVSSIQIERIPPRKVM